MAFARPTFDELVARISGDMRSQLLAAGKRADPLLRRSKMWVLARVYAGIYHVLYGVLQWLSLQILPSTATDIDYVIAYGQAFGIERQLATKAAGTLDFTGTNTTAIPLGTLIVREDGVTYITTEAGVIASGVAEVAVEAVEAGTAGNMTAGTTLSLASPIAGIDSEVAWASGFDAGTDDETVDALKDRILARMAQTPHGGAAGDYETWAREVAGVFRALAIPIARGAGTVDVYFLHTGGTGIGIPTTGQIEDVDEYLRGPGRRPVTADLLTMAPVEVDVDFTFGSLTPDNSGIRTAIEEALDDLFLSAALVSTTIHPSAFYTAIDAVDGLEGFDLDTPADSVECDPGEVLVRGDITWPS